MKIYKPKFWQKRINIFSFSLIPFSMVFMLVSKLTKYFTKENKFDIPIICVGNIYIGGTGKTPLVIKIANEISNRLKPAIIKKFYKSHKDEHLLIQKKFDNLFLNSNRADAIKEAQERKFNIVILDDGFQDHSIRKNLNILCFNSKQLVGNGWLFPSGPLRETLNSIKRVKIIVINGDRNIIFEEKVFKISKDIKIFYSKYLPANLNEFKNKKILAFAGIGNPENFFDLLKDNKLNVKKTLSYPDHYNFTEFDIQKIVNLSKKDNLEIVTTEKDFYRIQDYRIKEIKFLKIDLKILDKENFINQIINNI